MYNKNGNIGASVPDNKQLSRLLRIKVLFLLAAIGLSGSVAAQTSSPNARISLDLQNVPLKEVFARIEDQSNYIFVYYDSILDASRRVSISVSDQPVGNVLEVLFAGTENTWKLSGRQIVIGKAAAAGKAEKQTPLRVMGSVKDTNGEPLIGVTVFVKERPSVGTATDINGNYLIDVQTDDVLEFSYVGYKTQDVAVAGRGLLDIVLEQNDAILDAVEVVGYGVQKKINLTGSIAVRQMSEIGSPLDRKSTKSLTPPVCRNSTTRGCAGCSPNAPSTTWSPAVSEKSSSAGLSASSDETSKAGAWSCAGSTVASSVASTVSVAAVSGTFSSMMVILRPGTRKLV